MKKNYPKNASNANDGIVAPAELTIDLAGIAALASEGLLALALEALIAPDVIFYDTGQNHGVSGIDQVLAWQNAMPVLDAFTTQEPMAGAGWAVVRWTIRTTDARGVQHAVPGATVMEVRDGKVVRMTLYYNANVISLQE